MTNRRCISTTTATGGSIASTAVAIATTGPGTLSLDYALFGPQLFHPGWHGLFGSLLLGIGGALGQLALFYRPPVKQAH